MARCLLCDKKGVFLKVTPNGLCYPCDEQVIAETEDRRDTINTCRRVVESSKEPLSVKLSCYDLLMEAVNHLSEFEKRGIPTITPKPSEFISHFAGKRDQLKSFCNEPNGKPDQTITGEKILSEAEAIESLEKLCKDLTIINLDKPPLSQSKIDEIRARMCKTISEIEKQFSKSNLEELESMLATAILVYTEWFIRGDERTQYIQKAYKHIEKAEECYYTENQFASGINRLNQAWCRFNLDVNVGGISRDLEKFVTYLEPIFNNTDTYQPIFCHYVDAYRSLGNYEKAIKLGLELHHRAEKTKEYGYKLRHSGIESRYFMSSLPTAPMATVTKSYRKMAKDCKKRGEIEQAISLFEKLVDTGLATDNDKKLLAKLQH